MKGFQKVVIVGNLGRDVEVRNAGSSEVVNNSLAVTERVKLNGEWTDQTEWVNIVAWGGMAKTLSSYCRKGSRIMVEGKLQTRKWEKDGQQKQTTEVFVTTLLLLDSKPDRARETPPAEYGGGQLDFDPNSDIPF